MDSGDGLGDQRLHFAGAPGEFQKQLPGGGDCFADGALSEAEYHLSSEDGQQRGGDDDDGFEDSGDAGDEGHLQLGSPEEAAEDCFGIFGPHFDKPLAYINQILDYTEQAEHDDVPDSAASVCRRLDAHYW